MSQTETHIGTMRKISTPSSTFEVRVNYLEKLGFEIEEWDEKYIHCKNLIYIQWNDTFYELTRHKEVEDGDMMVVTDNDDGTMDFVLQYYNGGCGFEEAMEYALTAHHNKS